MTNREIFENSKGGSELEGVTLVRGIEGAFESIDELKSAYSNIEGMINRLESQSTSAVKTKNDEYDKAFFNACYKSFTENKDFSDCMPSNFRNEVTGYPFPELIDYQIRKAWKNYAHIFNVLRSTNRTQFLINTQDQDDADVSAKLHKKGNHKTDQNYVITSVNFYRGYIYKLNLLNKIDLKMAENDGTLANLIAELWGEITDQIIYLIVKSILNTSLKDDANNVIIEAIPESALTVNRTGALSIEQVRLLADSVDGMEGRKIAFMTGATKTELMKLVNPSSGLVYMTEDILMAQLGVDQIITFRGMPAAKPVTILIDQAYAVYNINDIERVEFDKWEFNQRGLLAEILTSGRVIAPKSAGVLTIG